MLAFTCTARQEHYSMHGRPTTVVLTMGLTRSPSTTIAGAVAGMNIHPAIVAHGLSLIHSSEEIDMADLDEHDLKRVY